jgi:hypothetical protein
MLGLGGYASSNEEDEEPNDVSDVSTVYGFLERARMLLTSSIARRKRKLAHGCIPKPAEVCADSKLP